MFPQHGAAVDPSAPVDWDHPLTRDMRGWWIAPPGIPGAGVKLNNLVSRVYGNGSLVGQTGTAPIWASGTSANNKSIPGLLFNGSSQYATIPTRPSLKPLNAITVGFRVRCSNTSNYPVVIRKSDDLGAPDEAWSVAIGEAGEGIIWEVMNATSALVGVTTSVFALDTDYDVFCVYDGSAMFVYQWAVATGALTTASAAQSLEILYSLDSPITIGVIGAASAVAFLPGRVDDPVLWGRALTKQQCDAWRQLRIRGFQTPESPLRWISPRTYSVPSGGGGTTPITPSGSSTATGSLTRLVSKALSGSSTGTGALAKLPSKALAGSSTSTGSVAKLATKPLAGSVTTLASLAKQANKGATGSSTAAGRLAKQAAKPLAGSSTPTGAETNQPNKAASGSTTPTGAETSQVSKAVAGSSTPAGSLAKAVSKPMDGSSTPSGALSTLKVALIALGGACTAAGILVKFVAKSIAGTLTGSGSLANQANKPLAGSVTPAGLLTRLAGKAAGGSITVAGSLAKSVWKYLAGLVTGTGALTTTGGTVEVTIDTPGGTFRRTVGLSRVFHRFAGLTRTFRRTTGLSRVFRRSSSMSILVTSLPIDTNESRAYIFDFTGCDEEKAGETLVSATVPALSGVTIGTPAVLTEATNFVEAGKGVKVTLSVASAAEYELECRGTFSGGGVVVIKGKLVGE